MNKENILLDIKKIKKFLENKKIDYFKVLDISNLTVVSDYFVIMSVSNIRALDATEKDIEDFCVKNNINIKNVEGKSTGWVLIDLYDFIIHIFVESERQFYNLEKVWADAKVEDV